MADKKLGEVVSMTAVQAVPFLTPFKETFPPEDSKELKACLSPLLRLVSWSKMMSQSLEKPERALEICLRLSAEAPSEP